jgi:hypothetical protein
MRMNILLALLLTLPIAGLRAQSIHGAGARPCGDWTQARTDGGRDFEGEQWALGYVSAVTLAGGTGRGLDQAALFSGVDAYCAAHPDEMLWSAVKAVLGSTHGS